MLAFFAGLHVIPIVKTFCLTPRNGVTEKSAFATSPLGWILGRDRKTDEEKEYEDFEREEKEQRNKVPPLMTSLLSADYLVSSVFFIIMNVRAVSFPGWSFNWFQWHFRFSFITFDLNNKFLKGFANESRRRQLLHGHLWLYVFHVTCVCLYPSNDNFVLCLHKSKRAIG